MLNAMLCRRALAAAATLLGAALPLSACGGDEGSKNSDVVRVPANLCALLTAADISEAIGRAFPPPQRTQTGLGEQDCTSVPTSGTAMSFKLFWGNCVDGKPPNMDCLNSVSGAFATNKQQTISAIEPIAGLGDQAFCIPGPFATTEVLKRWIYLTVGADTCPQAQKLAGTLLTNLGR
jgi:hypothetical protein